MTIGTYDYVRDGAEIYRRSFATIRAEADLSAFPADAHTLEPAGFNQARCMIAEWITEH